MYSVTVTSRACFYCRLNFQASEGAKTIQNFEKVLMLKLRRNCLKCWGKTPIDTQTDLLKFTFRRFAENVSSSFLNHLCSVFVAFFYGFGIPVSFSIFFSTILHVFSFRNKNKFDECQVG
jgi:hypothetical protein